MNIRVEIVDFDHSMNQLSRLADRMDLDSSNAPRRAADVIREAIISGLLQSGTALKQSSIADALQTSKIPLREALHQLEGQGLVDFEPNRGFVVSATSVSEMFESFKLRLHLEKFAVRESLPKATESDLDKVEALIDDFEKLTDVSVSSHWNLRLHLAFYAPAKMRHLERMITRAHTIAHRYTHIYMQHHGQSVVSQDEHRKILDAYRQGEVDLAVTLMDSHISVASNRFARDLEPRLQHEK
ncbi:GntR family transcriptional regulator [Roseibium sp. HPY-6]|uniref:GntR family transcriptional regulator n=1 Tax=Roseibium sp. HPY-6 TaxID=3229852 RepID=UPI00338F7AD3